MSTALGQTSALTISGLQTKFHTSQGELTAVDGVDLTVPRGSIVGLVGESGCGKSVTALSVLGLVPAGGQVTAGEICFQGRDLRRLSEKERRKLRGDRLAMIFQDPMTSLNPVVRVADQIMEMLRLHKHYASKKEAYEEACQLLNMVGIKRERANDYPYQFSGGMKQRVVIAIALACNPKLVIADEPTTALDVTIQAQVMRLMKNLKDQFGTSMILITHDLGIVAQICDKVAIMYAGSVVEYATKEKLYQNPSHPYTKGLFNSIPKLDVNEEWLEEIDGLPPEPTEQIAGCIFNPRCPSCMEICRKKKPGITYLDDEHYVSCFLFQQDGGQDEEGGRDE